MTFCCNVYSEIILLTFIKVESMKLFLIKSVSKIDNTSDSQFTLEPH